MGLTISIVAGLCAVSLIGWMILLRSSRDESFDENDLLATTVEEETPLSIVVLMRELPFVDINVLSRAMERAFQVDFSNAESATSGGTETLTETSDEELRFADGDNFAMATPMGSYMVRLNGHMHGVIAHDNPYFEDEQAAIDSVHDQRSKQALAEHKCWIAVDHIGEEPRKAELGATYGRIGRLLLELIDPTLCKAVLLPRQQRFYPWREGMDAALASEDVLAALNDVAHVPVTPVDGNSPEMKAAVAEAKQRWPEFEAAFQSKRGDAFGVKFLLHGDDDDSCEFPWMEVTGIHGKIIQGRLANEPIGRADLHEGSKVATCLAELNDWLYIDEQGEKHGGFTIPVLMKGLDGND